MADSTKSIYAYCNELHAGLKPDGKTRHVQGLPIFLADEGYSWERPDCYRDPQPLLVVRDTISDSRLRPKQFV